ncbi:unnamed protein product [Euphydryas editha]|uniref:Carboxypeptidase n=1 Tax=Euphydryas editha TaxID=104508 RepID=A0AAU9V288_EUPED|nr:unnamed protein product [Euphydryas editha]
MKGLFDLIGPFQIVDGIVTPRNVTWAKDYSLLFLDNPVGAGFSFTDDDRGYPDNEDDVGKQMYEFLKQFLQMFPELRQAPLFIAGESYAGKYVPALGIQIHRHRNIDTINLKGIMIGNGLIDPRSMMHYSDLCRVFGILSDEKIFMLQQMENNIVYLIDRRDMINAAKLFNATVEMIKKESGISVYNLEKNPVNSAPNFERFLANSKVRELIHVGNASFDFNNQVVYEKMLPDIMNSTKKWVEELLEYYGVLCYSGQLDVILAYSLSKYTYSVLDWSGRVEYNRAPRIQIRKTVNDAVIGYKKSGGNFVEVLIRNAGHATMVEQPKATKFIINNFIDEFK